MPKVLIKKLAHGVATIGSIVFCATPISLPFIVDNNSVRVCMSTRTIP